MASARHIKLEAGRFYGDSSPELQVGGFRLTESSYQPGASLPLHSHAQAHFISVLAGRYAETIGRTRAQRAPGATLFLPPDVPHQERHHVAGRHFMIEIEPATLEQWRERPGDFTCPVDLASDKAQRITTLLYEEFRDPDESSALVVEGLVLLLLTIIAERRAASHREPPPFLEQARQYIHDRLGSSLTIEQLAEVVGVNRWQLTRAFQHHYRCTPGEYLRRERLELARRELVRPGRRLADVAHAAGFSDQSHFSREFKLCTGLTPRQYQRQSCSRVDG